MKIPLAVFATAALAAGSASAASVRSLASNPFEARMRGVSFDHRKLQQVGDSVPGLSDACRTELNEMGIITVTGETVVLDCPSEDRCVFDFSPIVPEVERKCTGRVITSDYSLSCEIEGEKGTFEFDDVPTCIGPSCTDDDIDKIKDTNALILEEIEDEVPGLECEASGALAASLSKIAMIGSVAASLAMFVLA